MNNSPNIKQVETVLKYIKNELYSGRLQPGERLPAERRLADMLGVGRAHVRAAFQKLEFYGIVQTFPQSGTVVAQEKMQVLERMITDALQIRQYDFASLVYVRVLLEIEVDWCFCKPFSIITLLYLLFLFFTDYDHEMPRLIIYRRRS